MGLNDVVSADRLHISFFGKRNVGKSSLVNAITNQELSVVSDVKGTTTDPVKKAMELLPLGPVLIIDTPGYDDSGVLGEKRIQKTKAILMKTDVAVLVVESTIGVDEKDEELIEFFKKEKINYIIAYNKSDLLEHKKELDNNSIYVSATKKENINEIKEKIATLKTDKTHKTIVSHMLNEDDVVILVVPIDESAPKGRLILPQQQTIRDLLDSHIRVIVCQTEELSSTINMLKDKPKLVITDSQAFKAVSSIVPDDVLLTSFSILFANYKGELGPYVAATNALDNLFDNDFVLISEGCTHHRQCNDIGSVKIPNMLKKFTNKELNFEFTSGQDFPEDLSKYKLVVHCGGCMLNEREMKHRISICMEKDIPVINYGILIAKITGILDKSLEIFIDKGLM